MLNDAEKTILETAAMRDDSYNNAVGDLVDAFPARDFDSNETDEAERVFAAARMRMLEAKQLAWPIRFTTAEVGYDGFGTLDLGVVGHFVSSASGRNKPVRKVKIDPRHLSWQEQRYWSGMHRPHDEVAFRQLVEAGVIVVLA